MGELTTLQQVVLIATPTAAAIAALASWASVVQARRLAQGASRPRLMVQNMAYQDETIGVAITNVGGGTAVGAMIVLARPPYYVQGQLTGHGFLRPGETVHVRTEIQHQADVATSAVAICRDREQFTLTWSVDGGERILSTRIPPRKPRYAGDIRKLFSALYPDVDPFKLEQRPYFVTDDTPEAAQMTSREVLPIAGDRGESDEIEHRA